MWGEISKVPLPDFEPREESLQGIPQEGSLERYFTLRGFFKGYFTFKESPKRKSPRGYHHHTLLHKEAPYKAHHTRPPYKALPNRIVRNRSVSDFNGRPTLKIPQREILIKPYFDGTPLKGAIRNLSCFARGGDIYKDFQTYPSRGLTH